MLGDFIYTEEEVREEEGVRKHDVSRKIEKALKRFLALAAVITCCGLLWWFLINPAMMPATVTVSTFPGLGSEAVLRYARIGSGATYVSVNASEAQMLLSRHPLVESARVVKSFPDQISIHLEPRAAVAVSIARINGRMQPVYFDRHGVAFMIGGEPGASARPWLPVVSGLYSGALALYLGSRLPDPVLPLFSRIGAIMDEDYRIWQAISEISVAWNDNGTFDLVLYPVNHSIRVRMGSDISAEDIFYALLVLDAVRRMGDSAPSEIDLRSGIGVFSSEGGRLGG